MEKERIPEQVSHLKTVGHQAAEALRGYGYEDLADKYDQALHRLAPDSKEVLTHSRIASTTLKELNELAQNKHGQHPAHKQNVFLQQQLETTLQKQTETEVKIAKSMNALSFPAKLYLEEKSKPLVNAAQEVNKYLEGKHQYSHPAAGKAPLQRDLAMQLQSFRSLPTSQNMEKLESYTQQGIQVMKQDYETAKADLQKENEQYVARRSYLSPEGRAQILLVAEKGEFEMPNRVVGKHVLSRANYAQEQMDQYRHVKDKVIDLDQPREAHHPISASARVKEYTHLSAEQQQHYAALSTQRAAVASTKEQEVEM